MDLVHRLGRVARSGRHRSDPRLSSSTGSVPAPAPLHPQGVASVSRSSLRATRSRSRTLTSFVKALSPACLWLVYGSSSDVQKTALWALAHRAVGICRVVCQSESYRAHTISLLKHARSAQFVTDVSQRNHDEKFDAIAEDDETPAVSCGCCGVCRRRVQHYAAHRPVAGSNSKLCRSCRC
jgi:hypothetical protein